jgi:hypothetical protein
MKLRREYVIAVLAVLAVAAAIGAVYQFYYKQRLAQYGANLDKLKDLETALKNLETAFENKDPETYIKGLRAQVQPLAEKVVQRAQFFSTSDALQIDPVPEGKLLRFWYAEQFNKLLEDLRKDAVSRTPYIQYPESSTFGAPRPEELEGRNVTNLEVKGWLRLIKLGSYVTRMLMDAKAAAVYDVAIWSPRYDFDNLLVMRTVGLSFLMRYSDLAAFVDKLRLEDRYFNINAISVQNRYMRWPTEPPVEVRLLLTQADFNAVASTPAPAGAAPAAAPGAPPSMTGAPPMTPSDRLAREGFTRPPGSRPQQPPITRWMKIKRFLRNWYLWPF